MPGESIKQFVAAAVAIVVLLALMVPAGAQAETCLGAAEDVSRSDLAPGAERTLLCLVNLHRQNHEIAPLALEPSLAKAAGRHSKSMVALDFFAHDNPHNGSTPQSRANRAGYDGFVGENIVFTTVEETPQRLFELWKNSEGHNRNMLDPAYAVAGTGLELGWPDELAEVPPIGLTGTQVFGLEPTGATDTALDLVVSDECAAAHADLVPFKEAFSATRAARERAVLQVRRWERKLDAAETPAELKAARAGLRRANGKLDAAKAKASAALEALSEAVAKAKTACS